MERTLAKLTDRTVKTAAGRPAHGRTVRGLSLLVKPTGGRSWVLRYQHKGARRDMGLGPYPEVTLAEAREKALEHRRRSRSRRSIRWRRAGCERRPRERGAGTDLQGCGRGADREQATAAGATPSTRRSGRTTLATLRLSQARRSRRARRSTPPPCSTCCGRSGPTKPETASRVRQRIEAVLDYATALGARTGDNPARWRGHLDHLLPKPSQGASRSSTTRRSTGARRRRSWSSWRSATASRRRRWRSRS